MPKSKDTYVNNRLLAQHSVDITELYYNYYLWKFIGPIMKTYAVLSSGTRPSAL